MPEDNKPVEQGTENQGDVSQSQNQPEVGTESNAPDIEQEHLKLTKLSPEDLINLVLETRSEAKKRRLRTRELEEEIAKREREQELNQQAELEKNQEFQKLYGDLKEKTSDYEDLKKFKQEYIENCKTEVEQLKNNLTKADLELFELTSKNQTYDQQLLIIKKMLLNKNSNSGTIVDPSQSVARSTEADEPNNNGNSPLPFGNTGSVTDKALKALAKLRQPK